MERQNLKIREQRIHDAVIAAKELFLVRKIDAVKMVEIADRANIGVASLYRYFETKEAIAIAAAQLLWEEIKADCLPKLMSKEFANRSGIEQIQGILDVYTDLLQNHTAFLRFLSDFDSFCIKQSIPKEKLLTYENSMADFYAPYQRAVETGQTDGTVCLRSDPALLYLTVNHTMLALLKKITQGEILSVDCHSAEELEILKGIVLQYFQDSGVSIKKRRKSE
jgi:AcrR family transcriptional regulator